MPLGTWVWSNTYNGSHSVPLLPSRLSADVLTVPPNLVTQDGWVLMVSLVAWDPTRTAQTSTIFGVLSDPPTVVFVDTLGVEYLGLLSGFNSLPALPLSPSRVALASQLTGEFVTGLTAPFALPTATLNGGGTLRLRGGADLAAVSIDVSLSAALMDAGGVFSRGFSDAITTAATVPPGTSSGTITTSPDPDGRAYTAFVGIGGDILYTTFHAANPDFSADPSWANLAVTNNGSALWTGIGYLTAIAAPPATTSPYTFTLPTSEVSVTQIIAISPIIPGGGGSVQVVG